MLSDCRLPIVELVKLSYLERKKTVRKILLCILINYIYLKNITVNYDNFSYESVWMLGVVISNFLFGFVFLVKAWFNVAKCVNYH